MVTSKIGICFIHIISLLIFFSSFSSFFFCHSHQCQRTMHLQNIWKPTLCAAAISIINKTDNSSIVLTSKFQEARHLSKIFQMVNYLLYKVLSATLLNHFPSFAKVSLTLYIFKIQLSNLQNHIHYRKSIKTSHL